MGRISLNSWIWLPDEDLAYIPAMVTEMNGSTVTLNRVDESSFEVAAELVETAVIAEHSSIVKDYPNLVLLDEFTEGAIIHQLGKRYARDDIYTEIGSILISANPFKLMGIYTTKVLRSYRNAGLDNNLPPHVYQTAANAYQGLLTDQTKQAVVISGESGAGKTEATKLILQFLGEVAESPDGVEQQIMLSNPILEAFGNSKTLRNNNSSRFGKYMEIMFAANGSICGAKIINYLLEKSRVVYQTEGERNYHIFYQLLHCSDTEVKTRYKLLDMTEYKLLNQNGCYKVDGMNDATEFDLTLRGLEALQFTKLEIDSIWRILSGILYASNLEFEADGDGSICKNKDALEVCSRILQIESSVLENALCFRAVTIRKEVSMIKQSPLIAAGARDSFTKALYGSMFDWIVRRINDFLNKGSNSALSIGVLDIFGFEVFELNSFEQFCINYANEKLQQHFNKFIFEMEQQEYVAEGIDFETVTFVDNSGTLGLIEHNPGVLRMLDEETKLPRGGDLSYVEKMHQVFNKGNSANPFYDVNKIEKEVFIIKHYAGPVTYNVTGFVEKNRDNIYESLLACLMSSKCELITSIFTLPDEPVDEPSGYESSSSKSSSASSGRGTVKHHGKAKTLASKFHVQLNSLMDTLNDAHPHFVRCIKPNLAKVADKFDAPFVLQQMKYAGLFEAIRVRASGYSYRKDFSLFCNRYSIVLGREARLSIQKQLHSDARASCVRIVNEFQDLNQADLQIGKTKVFFRNSVLSVLENRRSECLMRFTVLIQTAARVVLAKKTHNKTKELMVLVRAAEKSNSIADLEAVFTFVHDEDIIVSQLHALHEQLEWLHEAVNLSNLLTECITLRDLDHLEGAIMQAEEHGIMEKSKDESIKKALTNALELRHQLLHTEDCKLSLIKHMEANDVEGLRKAIELARSLNFSPALLSEPIKTLEKLDNVSHILSDISKAIQAKDYAAIETGIEKSKSLDNLGSDDKEILAGAVETLRVHYADELEKAINSNTNDTVYVLVSKLKLIGGKKDMVTKAEKHLNGSHSEDLPPKVTDSTQASSIATSPDSGSQDASEESVDESAQFEWMLEASSRKNSGDAEQRKMLKLAIQAGDESAVAELMKDVGDADSLDPTARTFKMGKNMVKKRAKADLLLINLRESVADLDRDLMKELLVEARSYGLTGPEVSEAKKLCYGISDADFFAIVIDRAMENKDIPKLQEIIALSQKATASMNAGDVAKARSFIKKNLSGGELPSKRVKHRHSSGSNSHHRQQSIQFKTSAENKDLTGKFNQIKGIHVLADFSHLRDSDNYAKHKFFKAKALKNAMLEWQDTPIPRSLFKLSTDFCGGKNRSLALKNEAKDLFKNIMGYMKDRFNAYPITLAHELIHRGLDEPLLRDEIFCQLVKQTTNNPREESVILGWKLIYLSLNAFPPMTAEMKLILESHIAAVSTPQIGKFMPFNTLENVAANCWIAIHRNRPLGPDETGPTMEEIKQLTEAKPMKMKIFTENGDFLEISVAASSRRMTVANACSLISTRLRLYGSDNELHIITENKNLREKEDYLVSPDDSIVAVISYWEGRKAAERDLDYRFEYVVVTDDQSQWSDNDEEERYFEDGAQREHKSRDFIDSSDEESGTPPPPPMPTLSEKPSLTRKPSSPHRPNEPAPRLDHAPPPPPPPEDQNGAPPPPPPEDEEDDHEPMPPPPPE